MVDLKDNAMINTSCDIKNHWEQYALLLNSYQLPISSFSVILQPAVIMCIIMLYLCLVTLVGAR